MTCRRRIIPAQVAIGAALAISLLPAAMAQGQGRCGGEQRYRQAAGAKDLRAVLFNSTWAMVCCGASMNTSWWRRSNIREEAPLM